MRHITNDNMTVRDAMTVLAYNDFVYEYEQYAHSIYREEGYDVEFEKESEGVSVSAAIALVDDYDTLVTLIKERFGGAIGKVDFKTIESYNAEQINQMIDNYLESELVA